MLRVLTMAAAPVLLSSISASALAQLTPDEEDYELKLLGKFIFWDESLSSSGEMGCVTCHTPETGGRNGDSANNLHQVVITGASGITLGNTNPPSNTYASFSPDFHKCNSGGLGGVRIGGVRFDFNHCGGVFVNGRAEGNDVAVLDGATQHIGAEVLPAGAVNHPYEEYFGPVSDQALNPIGFIEQNISREDFCAKVASSSYSSVYEGAWGEPVDCSVDDADGVDGGDRIVDITFKRSMLAVGAYQHSSDVNSFSSKRDMALRDEIACVEGAPDADPEVCTHENFLNSPGEFPLVGLSKLENYGHDLFYTARIGGLPRSVIGPDGLAKTTNCAFCHSNNPNADNGAELLQTYTAHDYHNIGVPFNYEIPELYLAEPTLQPAPDRGLASHDGELSPIPEGFFRTPTMRNVYKRPNPNFVKAYMHNGFFKTLKGVVHFYNTALTLDRCEDLQTEEAGWIIPEGVILTEAVALEHNCWPRPEHQTATSAVGFLLGNLGLTDYDESALVAYIETLSDTWTAKMPSVFRRRR